MRNLQSENDPGAGWKARLADCLPVLGHRNWICVVDSAYPEQTARGVEVVPTGCDHVQVVAEVLDAISHSPHVRAIAYLDVELNYLQETDAPGIEELRKQLDRALEGMEVKSMLHEDIISLLDEAGEAFRVLVLKSSLTLPYTSLFLQLECGYWDAGAEQALREIMNSRSTDPVKEGK